MVTVFIVAGVVRFGIVNLHLQVGFPLRINQLGIVDVLIFRGIAGRRNRAGTACPYAGTGRKRGKIRTTIKNRSAAIRQRAGWRLAKTLNRTSGFFVTAPFSRQPAQCAGGPGWRTPFFKRCFCHMRKHIALQLGVVVKGLLVSRPCAGFHRLFLQPGHFAVGAVFRRWFRARSPPSATSSVRWAASMPTFSCSFS